MNEASLRKALFALHGLLVALRFNAADPDRSQDLEVGLDQAEYLVQLIRDLIDDPARQADIRRALADLRDSFPMSNLGVERFDAEVLPDDWAP